MDLIFAPTTIAAVAARDATRQIAIVFAVAADPIGAKLVASLARPGGNITGLTTSNTEVAPKRLQLLKELLRGKVARIALVLNPGDQSDVLGAKSMQEAGRALGIDVLLLEVRSAEDLDRTFASLASARFRRDCRGRRRPDRYPRAPNSGARRECAHSGDVRSARVRRIRRTDFVFGQLFRQLPGRRRLRGSGYFAGPSQPTCRSSSRVRSNW